MFLRAVETEVDFTARSAVLFDFTARSAVAHYESPLFYYRCSARRSRCAAWSVAVASALRRFVLRRSQFCAEAGGGQYHQLPCRGTC